MTARGFFVVETPSPKQECPAPVRHRATLMDNHPTSRNGPLRVGIGGPALAGSDLLILNKSDLAPLVGAALDAMRDDAQRRRAGRPFVFAALRHGEGVGAVVEQPVALGALSPGPCGTADAA